MTRFGMDVTLAHPREYRLMDQCVADAKKNAAQGAGTSFEIVDNNGRRLPRRRHRLPEELGPLLLDAPAPSRASAQRREANAGNRAPRVPRPQTQRIQGVDLRREAMRLTPRACAIYMHCLPADIGAEVSAGVLEQFRFSLAREANKKVYVIMALLAAAKTTGLRSKLYGLAATAR